MQKNTLIKILIGLVSVLLILVSLSFITSFTDNKEDVKIQKGLDSISDAYEKEVNLKNLSIKNRNIRNNWNKYFKVNTNSYSYLEFGGIENLQIIFSNDSDYILDNAYIDVCYVIDNGTCYKTETVLFKNIPSHAVVTQNAPSSLRGKKISLNISQIYCDKLNFLYGSNVVFSESSIDPYFSKD